MIAKLLRIWYGCLAWCLVLAIFGVLLGLFALSFWLDHLRFTL